MVKLPAASSASFVLRFLETMCRHLQCDNLFSSQPFSHYAAYDRTKSGKPCRLGSPRWMSPVTDRVRCFVRDADLSSLFFLCY